MKTRRLPFIIYSQLFFLLISCQGKINQKSVVLKKLNLDGIYLARLNPINPYLSKYLNGSLTIRKDQNVLFASVRFSQGPNNSIHEQSLYFGKRCPNYEDDLNGDQFIDSNELGEIINNKLIPLDDDLSSQRIGSGIFPKSDEFGSYQWARNTLFDLLLKDLKDEDLNLKDSLVKIDQDEELKLENLVIIIKGISLDTFLPETVSNRKTLNGHLTFPIACGVLKKILKTPGIIDSDFSYVEEEIESPTNDDFDFPELEMDEDINYG